MSIPVIIALSLFALFFIVTLFIIISDYKSLIKRARKIDPTVKTAMEAEYVLKKDIAQNIGNNDQQNRE